MLNPERENVNNTNELDNISARGQATHTRAQETFKKMQEAELAAAEEKHKKLLKKLRKGGHDTTALEQKFAELKARLTGGKNSSANQQQEQNPTNLKLNLNLLSNQIDYGTSNSHVNNKSSMSIMSESESKLNKEKHRLEKQLFLTDENNNNDGNSSFKMRKILQILKEDPDDDISAELSENQLRQLLKSVARNDNSHHNAQSSKGGKYFI